MQVEWDKNAVVSPIRLSVWIDIAYAPDQRVIEDIYILNSGIYTLTVITIGTNNYHVLTLV